MSDGDTLAELGWDGDWQRRVPGPGRVGRILRQDRGWVKVATADGVESVRTREDRVGTPVVGDWIVIDDEPDDAEVGAVLERRNSLRRADPVGEGDQVLAANLDQVLIVAGLDRPVKAGRIQRALVQVADADAEPMIVLTKTDLVADAGAIAAEVQRQHPGVDVVAVSSQSGAGIDDLGACLRGTVVLLGESGAGKSSLLNSLGGTELAEVGEVRSRDSKGRHTTTRRELHLLPGGALIVDTPGIRGIGVFTDPSVVIQAFPDIATAAALCRFADCTHDTEPGCAVVDAVARGDIAVDRVDALRELVAEAAWHQRPDHERRGRAR